MLIVIPVSVTDEKLINDFSDCLNHFGPYSNHELLVVSRPSDILHAVNLLNRIKSKFKTIDIHAFPEDGKRGWPQGPNFYWQETIKYLKKETALSKKLICLEVILKNYYWKYPNAF